MPDNNEPKKVKKIIKLKMKSSVKGKPTKDTEEIAETKVVETKNTQATDKRPEKKESRQQPQTQTQKRSVSKTTSRPIPQREIPPTQQKETSGKTRRKSVHGKKTNQVYNRDKNKSAQEEIYLSKMESTIRNKQRRGEAVVPDEIKIGEVIMVSDLAKKMNLKAGELIKKLIELGVMATINDNIDSDTASIVAEEYNCKVQVKSLKEEVEIQEEEDKPEDLEDRSPIITIMGHVDHGKTKLLDAIRHTNVAEHESGGITQHIGAYKVKTSNGDITFLDTPGHEAFTAMRARGALVTDIVILVIAANDGIMPQTVEAINHAKAANVPIVVAINKTDLPEANIERAKQQLAEHNLLPDDWGGDTMCISVSALKKIGLDELLDSILLQAEMMELKANPNKRGVGFVIESKMDIGKGPMATVVVTNGRIQVGDHFVVGTSMGKIRAMFDDKGKRKKLALPSDPIEIMGLSEVPEAGDKFYIVENDETARGITEKRQAYKKIEENKNVKKIQMQNAMQKLASPDLKEVKVIIKADVQGSVEAIKQSLEKLKNKEIKITIIHAAVGAVTERDVMLASAGSSEEGIGVVILAFRVRVDSIAKEKAESEALTIRRYTIIYELIDYMTSVLEKQLPPEVTETVIGQAEVMEVFKISNIGKIAGCQVTDGVIKKSENVRLYRDGAQVWEGKIENLKRFQDEVNEVQEGFECGISLFNYENIKKNDIIESYSQISKQRKFVPEKESKIVEEEEKETPEETTE